MKRNKDLLETYQPKKRIGISKERTVPVIIRIGNKLLVIGGSISFFISSFLVALKGIFGVKQKVNKFSFNKKVIDLRRRKKSK